LCLLQIAEISTIAIKYGSPDITDITVAQPGHVRAGSEKGGDTNQSAQRSKMLPSFQAQRSVIKEKQKKGFITN
jgi:hypothetical protein